MANPNEAPGNWGNPSNEGVVEDSDEILNLADSLQQEIQADGMKLWIVFIGACCKLMSKVFLLSKLHVM